MKNIKYLLIIVFFKGFMISCSEDILVLDPLDEYSDAAVWKDPVLAELFVNGCYQAIPMDYAKFLQMCFVDEGHRRTNANVTNFNNCILNPDTDIPGWTQGEAYPKLMWSELYKTLRKCNIVIANVDKLPDNPALTDGKTKKDRMRGEGYFLRAYTYLLLSNLYGGVPIVEKAYGLDDEYIVPRNTYEETINFIVGDCDRAAALLPDRHTGNNNGRATRPAAMALKARILLYAASDLHNTFIFKNTDGSAYSNPELVKYTSGNQRDRWVAAKNAAQAVINLNIFSLYRENPATGDSIAQNFVDFFLEPLNTQEDIFIRYFAQRLVPYNNNILNNSTPNGYKGGGNNAPLGNLVDDYEMKDGTQFSWNNPAHAVKPYEYREPRFYASILYEGAKWRTRPADVAPYDPIGIINIGEKEVWNSTTGQMVEVAGIDGRKSPFSAAEGTESGYYLRKFMDPSLDGQYQNIAQGTPFRCIRFAEILLNYAEACIELGEYDEAKTALNRIRKRAGLPNITETGDALRERYRHERRIEMALENHRMWDVRRWAIGQTGYVPARGVRIRYLMDPDTKVTSPVPTITPVEFEKRSWIDKAYFFPIMRVEMNRNNLLIQNPGY